jgi:DNA polymerase family B
VLLETEGPLRFDQDVLYSKLAKATRVVCENKESDDHNPNAGANHALLRRELSNAVLTSDLLEVIEKVATAPEVSALRSTKVKAAAAYLARDRHDTIESWCRAIFTAPTHELKARLTAGLSEDTRPRDWFAVPLSEFVGPLSDARQQCKAAKKSLTTDDEELRRQLDGRDTVLKLLINTLYGIIGSRFFPIGNTIVANNITARGRRGVWMLAKALHLRQTITDGGIYTPDKVAHYNTSLRRPGIATLSRIWEWHQPNCGRRLGPLSERPMEPGVLPEWADEAALAHVQRFWAPYGLTFNFGFTHKPEHTFLAAAYWSKSDYAIDTLTGRNHVLRGKETRKLKKHAGGRIHPSIELLNAILDGNDEFPVEMLWSLGGILKIGRYRQAKASEGAYTSLRELMPGDSLPVATYTARFNNIHFPLADAATYLRRRNRRKVHRGGMVEWFERFRQLGIAEVHRRMRNDTLR